MLSKLAERGDPGRLVCGVGSAWGSFPEPVIERSQLGLRTCSMEPSDPAGCARMPSRPLGCRPRSNDETRAPTAMPSWPPGDRPEPRRYPPSGPRGGGGSFPKSADRRQGQSSPQASSRTHPVAWERESSSYPTGSPGVVMGGQIVVTFGINAPGPAHGLGWTPTRSNPAVPAESVGRNHRKCPEYKQLRGSAPVDSRAEIKQRFPTTRGSLGQGPLG